MSETSDIVAPTVAALKQLGIYAIRMNSGTIRKGNRVIRGAPAGTPDIMGALPGGKMFGLEAKLPGKKLSPAQLAWGLWAHQYGVLFCEFNSPGQALKIVQTWRETR